MTEPPDDPSNPDSTPASVPPPAPAAPSSRRVGRIVLQVIGFLVGMLLLWWCARQALAEQNRAQIQRLGEASVLDVAALAGLSLATIILNGLVFWVALRPAKRLPPLGVIATNALATFLNYLPFKLSVVARVLIHNKRDGVPILTIGAWFASVAAVLLAVYAPLVGVSLWRRSIDAVWVAAGLAGILASLALLIGLARLLCADRGRARIEAITRRLVPRSDPGAGRSFLQRPSVARLYAGLDMLASPSAVGAGAALRLVDITIQAARFVVAAGVLGVAISWQDAVLVACTYFLIGVASPAGQLGTREAGTTWLGGLLALAGGADLAVVMLLVSATESLVSLVAAGAAIIWLRPDRLLRGARGPRPVSPAAPD